MNKSKLRIVQDFVDFNENKPEGIYLHVNENDIFTNYAMIIGPEHTPYFGGFYLFEIKFPKNYPDKSPSVKFITIDGKVRFNPNLYEGGKVCLSILGTWSGPGWKKVMTLKSVLLSIQSLLHEFPVINEPGFEETKPDDEISIKYNQYLTYYNYKLAIIDVIDSLFSNDKKICHVDKFKKEIISELQKNFKTLNDNLKSYQITLGILEIGKFIYFVRKLVVLDFLDLNCQFDNMVIKISEKNEFNLI